MLVVAVVVIFVVVFVIIVVVVVIVHVVVVVIITITITTEVLKADSTGTRASLQHPFFSGFLSKSELFMFKYNAH